MFSLTLAVILASLTAVCYLANRLLSLPQDPREPPPIPESVPFIEHIQGLLRHGSLYYTRISSKFPQLPIYTLRVPFSKIYVVNSPALVAATDRHPKSISFGPYLVLFAKQMLQPSQRSLNMLATAPEEVTEGEWGLQRDTLKVMHDSMSPGVALEDTTRAMLESVTQGMKKNDSLGKANAENVVGLFAWARDLITLASTDAVYGAKNPLQIPSVRDDFWAIDKDFAYLGLNILPQLVARRAHRARQRFFDAFDSYYASGGHEQASHLIKIRYEINRKYGISQSDIAHFDLSISTGLLVNASPSTAWALYHAFSAPEILSELRKGISSYIRTTRDDVTGRPVARHLNIAEVTKNYPFLQAFINETLRVQSTNASGRVVLDDTTIEDNNGARFLLKKGSVLLVPSAELHNNADAWGPSPADFNAERFMPKSKSTAGSAYRAFGGGAWVCPGRHFAINEVAIVLVITLCRFDLVPVGKEGWKMPECRPHISTSVLSPVGDLAVEIRERPGADEGEWCFSWEKV